MRTYLQILRVLGIRQLRNFLVERERHRAARRRVDSHSPRFAVQVARLGAPDLALPVIGRQLQDVAVLPVVGLVHVQHRLHGVVARRHLRERLGGETVAAVADGCRRVGRKRVDVHAEKLVHLFRVLVRADLLPRLTHLEPRFAFRIGRKKQQHSAVDCRCAQGLRHDDMKCERPSALARRDCGAQCDRRRESRRDAPWLAKVPASS